MLLPTDWKAADTRLEGKRFLWGGEKEESGSLNLKRRVVTRRNKQSVGRFVLRANKRLTNAPSRGNPGREFHY